MGWKIYQKKFVDGQFQIKNRPNNTSNPRYLSVKLFDNKKGEVGLTNEGFKGMGIKKDLKYDFSSLYKIVNGSVKIHAELIDEQGKIVGEGSSEMLSSLADEWKKMASYAPLFAHADGWQWTPDLIWVDNLRSYGTPNYYVQKLYSNHKGTHVLNLNENGAALAGKDSVYASAAWDKAVNEVIIKIVNVSGNAQNHEL